MSGLFFDLPLSMMATRRKSPALSISAVSRATGVARQTLRQWRDTEGVDISDVAAVCERAKLKRPATAPSPPSADTAETYSEARRRREIALANRAEILAERESGAVVDLADVQATFAVLAAELKARLLAMRADLVVELEGQSGPAIHRILDTRICELLEKIHSNSKQ